MHLHPRRRHEVAACGRACRSEGAWETTISALRSQGKTTFRFCGRLFLWLEIATLVLPGRAVQRLTSYKFPTRIHSRDLIIKCHEMHPGGYR
jgi:hypothetical protein